MEKDNELKGVGNSLDFGARIYDSRVARWLSVDPQISNMPWSSSYAFSSNSPIWRLDPDGEWDIEIHSFANRGKMSYGICIIRSQDGTEIERYVVRVAGSAGAGAGKNVSGNSRTIKNGDTPTGTYSIDKKSPWWSNKKDEQAAYGTSSRLAITGRKGEIMDASSERQRTIRLHAGRQEINNKNDFDPKNKLKFTNGCVRMYQEDLDDMMFKTTTLQKEDISEIPGDVNIKDDLIEDNGKYYIPSDYIFLITSRTALQGAEASKDKKSIETAKDLVNKAEGRGLDPQQHQN